MVTHYENLAFANRESACFFIIGTVFEYVFLFNWLTVYIHRSVGVHAYFVSLNTDNTLYIKNSQFAPKMTLVGDEGKEIKSDEFWDKLVAAIDGKAIEDSPVLTGELCECELTYTVRIAGTYPKGYYLTFHDHGVEISAYCKYRKCMDLLGIVTVDSETMSELIGMLVEV